MQNLKDQLLSAKDKNEQDKYAFEKIIEEGKEASKTAQNSLDKTNPKTSNLSHGSFPDIQNELDNTKKDKDTLEHRIVLRRSSISQQQETPSLK